MAPSCRLLLLLQLCSSISVGLACFCDNYPWGSWSGCSRSCNHGTQQRSRTFTYNEYYWHKSCSQICPSYESRACNQQLCPINCLLTEFGPWSDCSPCAKKQFRTRSVQRPSQFGGSACSEVLTEERDCHPATQCMLAPVDCTGNFKCDNGRCIKQALTCNKQNDCGDNSDERDCATFKIVCPAEKRVAPGADLVQNGFDALAKRPRGAVLDNMFMGEECNIKRPRSTQLYHRVPHNFETFEIKVGAVEDFSTEPQQVYAEPIKMKQSHSSRRSGQNKLFFIIFIGYVYNSNQDISSNSEAFEASKRTDSRFFRVHQILPVSKFKMRDPGDLVLSLPFLQFLHALPLEYNYALYRDIFQRFGTHYHGSGTLGGIYDLVYQYDREEFKSSGQTEEHFADCLQRDSTWTIILYTEVRRVNRCTDTRITQKYEGSYIKASEKSFSMVKGGRAREAQALVFERQKPSPDKESYKNWAKSLLDNPAVVEMQAHPILDLVKGIPCARTKRRHLRKALLQYQEEFDSCKCAPCPNNAEPVLAGSECKCICQIGTFGTNCERRAADYTSEAVDGYWSCWGPWSRCGGTMKRYRTRRCNNPAPLRGGQPCNGPDREEDSCHISMFKSQETCDNDDDYTIGIIEELPPGVQGCLRPQQPPNSFLRKGKLYYSFGEDEEFRCYTGFELEGFQFINCLPDGTWSQPSGRCVRKICLPLEIPDDMALLPTKEEYKVGETVTLDCSGPGLAPLPRGVYRCSESLTWEPPLPAALRCTNEEPFVPEPQCGPGETLRDSKCVCIQRESCLSQPENLCVLNTDISVMVSMSLCSFHAGRCHGDPLFFVSDHACNQEDTDKLEWVKFRAQMSSKSSIKQPCGLDTCYEWETCSAFKKCECRAARACPRVQQHMFCLMLTRNQRTRSMDLCSMAALKCSSYEFEILNEGICPSR